jgi:uncharacterized membrane protein YczE
MIGKLLGIATVGSTLAGVSLVHRFLFDAVGIIILTIITAFMFCILLAGGFCIAYFGLVHYGLDPYVAGMTVGLVAFIITAVLIMLTANKLNQLRDLTHHSLNPAKLGLLEVSNAALAFVDGFLSPLKQSHSK